MAWNGLFPNKNIEIRRHGHSFWHINIYIYIYMIYIYVCVCVCMCACQQWGQQRQNRRIYIYSPVLYIYIYILLFCRCWPHCWHNILKPFDVWDNSIHRLSTYSISRSSYSATGANKSRNPPDNGTRVQARVGCMLDYLKANRIPWPRTTALLNRDKSLLSIKMEIFYKINTYLKKSVAYLIPHKSLLYGTEHIIQSNVLPWGLVLSGSQKPRMHHKSGYQLWRWKDPCSHGGCNISTFQRSAQNDVWY